MMMKQINILKICFLLSKYWFKCYAMFVPYVFLFFFAIIQVLDCVKADYNLDRS